MESKSREKKEMDIELRKLLVKGLECVENLCDFCTLKKYRTRGNFQKPLPRRPRDHAKPHRSILGYSLYIKNVSPSTGRSGT